MKNDENDLVGATIRGYYLEEILGAGGMGVVYKARSLSSSQFVAVKILLPKERLSVADYQKFLQRFRREAHIIANLHHPNIVSISDYGEYEQPNKNLLPYLVMPLLTGKTLSEKLERDGPFPLRETLVYIKQAAEALTYAHSRGIIHRDLKPTNFLFNENGQLILTDFGVAHIQGSTLTEMGEFIGTRAYASPEVEQGKRIDHRADIYSLGIVLFEMLTGDIPARTGQHHVTITSEVNAIIQKAIAPHPDDRYSDALQLAQATHRAVQHLHSAPTIVTPPASHFSSFGRFSRAFPSLLPSLFQPWSLTRGLFIIGLILLIIISGVLFVKTSATSSSERLVAVSVPIPTVTVLEQAKEAVKSYYTDWQQKKYAAAYALLDKNFQREYSYPTLLPDYQHTHQICLTIESASFLQDGSIAVFVTDNAVEDKPGGGGTAINQYQGYFLVKHQSPGWRLTPNLHLVSSQGVCEHSNML